MKRDKNIMPLSRDHHFSLLFCWKIRQGLSKNIDLGRIRSYILYFWKEHLEKHFEEEETLLFDQVSDPLCARAKEEHRQIRNLITSLTDTRENYKELADLIESHIRFEERQLFPLLEKALTPDQLSAVGAQLDRQPLTDSFADTFWS
jgi:hemerythrin-like domain-containing protein